MKITLQEQDTQVEHVRGEHEAGACRKAHVLTVRRRQKNKYSVKDSGSRSRSRNCITTITNCRPEHFRSLQCDTRKPTQCNSVFRMILVTSSSYLFKQY